MRRAKFNRGDIVRVNLNPTERREQQGDYRLALVLTPAAYNATGFAVTLSGSGTETPGVVLCNQIRTVDLEFHGAKRVEAMPEVVMDDVLARVQALFE